MLTLLQSQRDALAQRTLVRRLFVWCEARDPETGGPAPAGFWDDVGTIEYLGRTYHGSGSLIQISTLTAPSDLTIPGLRITVSGLSPDVASLVRGSTVGQAPITVSIGIFDPGDRNLIGGLIKRFVGFVDDIDISTPPAGDKSVIELTCESTSRALTIQRSDTRSEASLKQRNPTDGFYNYTGVQREKPLYFGQKTPA